MISNSIQAALIEPVGLAPGETYQLPFMTSGTTNALVSTKVFNMNGELLAGSYADFWQGRIFNVWTGSLADGSTAGANALGGATVRWGESTIRLCPSRLDRGGEAQASLDITPEA